MSKEIKNRIIEYKQLDFKSLEWFQPTDLKVIDEEKINKLKRSLIKNGFLTPFFVWQNKNKNLIIDSHIRQLALSDLINEDKVKLKKVQCAIMDIKNKNEAKKFVSIFNSHYADIHQDNYLDWIGNEIDKLKDEIEIPNIDFDIFEDEENEEINTDNMEDESERLLLVIKFETEKELRESFDKLTGDGYECKIII
jgi:hypothetical protein